MERTERIALLHGLLTRNRYGLSNDRLMREAECSRSTLYRDLSFMRDTLGAPLEHEGDPARIWRYVNRDARPGRAERASVHPQSRARTVAHSAATRAVTGGNAQPAKRIRTMKRMRVPAYALSSRERVARQ